MNEATTSAERAAPGRDEVVGVARGMATAVAPESGITDVQTAILR